MLTQSNVNKLFWVTMISATIFGVAYGKRTQEPEQQSQEQVTYSKPVQKPSLEPWDVHPNDDATMAEARTMYRDYCLTTTEWTREMCSTHLLNINKIDFAHAALQLTCTITKSGSRACREEQSR